MWEKIEKIETGGDRQILVSKLKMFSIYIAKIELFFSF